MRKCIICLIFPLITSCDKGMVSKQDESPSFILKTEADTENMAYCIWDGWDTVADDHGHQMKKYHGNSYMIFNRGMGWNSIGHLVSIKADSPKNIVELRTKKFSLEGGNIEMLIEKCHKQLTR